MFSITITMPFISDQSIIAENWPQWRGPHGTGVSNETGLPIIWDENRSIIWKCALPQWGTSTPAIWDDAVFVTSHIEDDKLLLMRIDKRSGEIHWTREVGSGTAPRESAKRSTQKFHRLHNLASPSPVTDGKSVVVHFGNGDLAAYDFDGNQTWKRNLQEDNGVYTIWWGHANSPVLHDGLVISVCMQDSLTDLQQNPVESYIVAHDVRDGFVNWKITRTTKADAEQCDAYTTPLLADLDNRRQLIVMGGNQLDAYDPTNGARLWFLPGLVGGRTVPSPSVGHGLVFAVQGLRGPLLGVKPKLTDGETELTYRDVKWKYKSGTPDTCCPVLWDNWLFTVTDDGVARCHDTTSGYVKWKARLPGKYKASPVAVDGRVFFLNTDGQCSVISASSHLDRLTTNQLDDETIASPAISDGQFFIRGKKTLYCIGRGVK